MPLNAGKSVTEFLIELQKNLKDIHDYAETHSEQEQHRYVTQYNKRAKEKCFEIGQQVIVLVPDSTNKWLSRWQGPGASLMLGHRIRI